MSSGLRAFRKRPKAGEATEGTLVVRIIGGMPSGFFDDSNPAPRTIFKGHLGQRCVCIGGLPDILMGEADPRNRAIHTGSAERASEYDSASIAEMRAAHAAAMARDSENELEAAAALRVKKRLAPGPTGK